MSQYSAYLMLQYIDGWVLYWNRAPVTDKHTITIHFLTLKVNGSLKSNKIQRSELESLSIWMASKLLIVLVLL